MCGRAYGPRFLFTWPNAKVASWAPAAGRGALHCGPTVAEAAGRAFDEEADGAQRRGVEEQIERGVHSLFMTGKLYDDGIIDPETPGPCSASPFRQCTRARSKAGVASGCSGCERRRPGQPVVRPVTKLLIANRAKSPGVSCGRPGVSASRRWPFTRTPTGTLPSCARPTRRCACPRHARRDLPRRGRHRGGSDRNRRRRGAPGYGFLRRTKLRPSLRGGRPGLRRSLPEAIGAMGSKLSAKELMGTAGVPVLPGASVTDPDEPGRRPTAGLPALGQGGLRRWR